MVSPMVRSHDAHYGVAMGFSAEVLSAGMGGHAALVPPEVAASFSTRRPAVVGTVNGMKYRSRLMVYGGKTYLGLRKNLLRQIGAAAGDTVQIELAEDHTERVVSEPPELLEALADNPAARAAYDALAYSHRLEYARWISEGKQAETRAAPYGQDDPTAPGLIAPHDHRCLRSSRAFSTTSAMAGWIQYWSRATIRACVPKVIA